MVEITPESIRLTQNAQEEAGQALTPLGCRVGIHSAIVQSCDELQVWLRAPDVESGA